MTRNLGRVGLATGALAVVATVSVVLTLAVSRSDGPRTYTQEEVNRQLAAAQAAAEPTATPSTPPTGTPADGTETSTVIDQGTFVGRCVSGYALLSRWTLNNGYRVIDPNRDRLDPLKKLRPFGWFYLLPGDSGTAWRVVSTGGGLTFGLLLQDDKNAYSWVVFGCDKGQFTAQWISSNPKDLRLPVKPSPSPTK